MEGLQFIHVFTLYIYLFTYLLKIGRVVILSRQFDNPPSQAAIYTDNL